MLLTDESSSVVWEGEFLPFGEEYSISGSITNNLRFPGQYYDSETGLHYNYYRDYNPAIGRYVEADPIGIERGNNHLFVYVGNNPVRFKDIFGLSGKKKPREEYGQICADSIRRRLGGTVPCQLTDNMIYSDALECCLDLFGRAPIVGSAPACNICVTFVEKILIKRRNEACKEKPKIPEKP